MLFISFFSFLTTVAYLLIANFFLHTLAVRNSENSFGQALSFLS